MIGVGRFGIWRPPQDFGARYRGDPRRFSAYGLVAMWDTARQDTKTFNGNDISGLASIVAGGIDVSQATAANQPLGVGTPQYGEFPSIQFSSANLDTLFLANTNLRGTGDITIISVQKWTDAGVQGGILSNEPSSTVAGCAVGTTSGVRNFHEAAIANYPTVAPSATMPEVWVFSKQFAVSKPQMWTNGVMTVPASGPAVGTDPGPTASVTIGNKFQTGGAGNQTGMDFCLGAFATTVLPDSVIIRISHALGARAGVAA